MVPLRFDDKVVVLPPKRLSAAAASTTVRIQQCLLVYPSTVSAHDLRLLLAISLRAIHNKCIQFKDVFTKIGVCAHNSVISSRVQNAVQTICYNDYNSILRDINAVVDVCVYIYMHNLFIMEFLFWKNAQIAHGIFPRIFYPISVVAVVTALQMGAAVGGNF